LRFFTRAKCSRWQQERTIAVQARLFLWWNERKALQSRLNMKKVTNGANGG
jgi:hypothetical protein